MSELSDEELDKLLRQHYRTNATKEQADQVWHRLASELGPQQIIPRRGSLPARLIFATLQLLIVAFVAAVLLSNGFFAGQSPQADKLLMPPTETPSPWVQKALEQAVVSGTPRILLSKQVPGWQLPCLTTFGNNRSTSDQYVVLVLDGKYEPMSLPGDNFFPPRDYQPPTLYIYDINHQGITGVTSPDWGRLRVAFGGPLLPQDNPLYVSPDGQPSMGGVLQTAYEDYTKFYQLGRQQLREQKLTISGWTVTVVSAYGEDQNAMVAYTITGPSIPYAFDAAKITSDAAQVDISPAQPPDLPMRGPFAQIATFYMYPSNPKTSLPITFEIPAIHVRSVWSHDNCNPTTGADQRQPTVDPDLDVIGPFTFDIDMPVHNNPTPIPGPTPIPTQPMPIRAPQPNPDPVPTGAASPLEMTATPGK